MRCIFTKRIACNACAHYFTITSAASKFCKVSECVRARRKAYRLECKQRAINYSVRPGSEMHLAQALRSGE